MNLNKIFSKASFLLLLTAALIGCETEEPDVGVVTTEENATTGEVTEDAPLAETQTEEEIVPDEPLTETQTEEEVIEDEPLAETQTEENVTTGEVAEDASELMGETVTIRSNAIEVIEPSTFVVADQEFFGGEDIVVVNATGSPFELPTTDDTEVQITGEVTEFVVSDIESAYDLDLDPDLYVEYTDRPAIIAQSLAIAPEPSEITADPSQYYGETIAVKGEVEDIYSDNVFSIDEEGLLAEDDLLVLVTGASEPVNDSETVAATGELRSFVVADLERDYDLTWDLDLQRELEAEYSERPVLVVDRVYSSAIPAAAK
ncbi:hypothetical protein [Myxosarcina sp. GI1(2024)]